MPDLDFHISEVKAATRSLTPLLQFQLTVTNHRPAEAIHAILLHAQIQIQTPQRGYNSEEKERLVDLFGTPDRWGQTLRTRLWTSAHTTVKGFDDTAEATLTVPCSYDLNFAATKYFYALEGGEVPLLFLFSGTVFYAAPGGRWQVQQISWDKECSFRMPVAVWKDLMEAHYPKSAWLYLDRDVFEQLFAFKRDHGLATWEQAMGELLAEARLHQREEALA